LLFDLRSASIIAPMPALGVDRPHLVVLAIVAGGLGAAMMGYVAWRDFLEAGATSETTCEIRDARVLDTSTTDENGSRDESYYVVYDLEYDLGGVRQRGEARLYQVSHASALQRAGERGSTRCWYNPSAPEVLVLGRGGGGAGLWPLLLMIMVAALLGPLFFFHHEREKYRRAQRAGARRERRKA
jgi:hypothetical protein